MSEKIKRINRELKFKGKILDFYQDTIEVDGDHTVVWDFIGHKGAAAVVPVTADGPALKVVRCPFSVVCPKEVSTTFLQRSTPLSMCLI